MIITMSRPLRISFDNAVYHITARGNRKEKIFYSDDDKRIFLQKMHKYNGVSTFDITLFGC